MQMASAVAVEVCGGPKIPMRYGRVDVNKAEECPAEGNLPDGNAPFGDGSADASEHVKKIYTRMGFNDQEAVALSGAHTIGRAQKSRSGVPKVDSTKYTAGAGICPHAISSKAGSCGKQGGQSWTPQWLK
jgi:L-ascorbate peroxidase